MLAALPCRWPLRLLDATLAAAVRPRRAPRPDFYGRRVWQSADGLPEDFTQALAQTADGYLWIGTSGGLVRFDGVRFAVFNAGNEAAFRDDSVYALLTARDGTLWAGTEGGGLVRYRTGAVPHVRRGGRPHQSVRSRRVRRSKRPAVGRHRPRPVSTRRRRAPSRRRPRRRPVDERPRDL